MGEIIDDVPSSYWQLEDLTKYQIFLISQLVGEWKTYAKWLWQEWEFETLHEFCTRMRDQYADLYGEAIEEEAQEDVVAAEFEEKEDVVDFSTDEESQEDKEWPPAKSNKDIGTKELWI